ncbi:hypothetical protein [Curtobacterium sp. 20TX0008]|uniref:hypothetical protein n=1 Tax=Curtobacterium sp. 20TX0008 TaxID=3022018 RepID=UPI00232E7679|nr:hypothetical protein [Curtobacterium sp. 20TX0008]MDB6425945.1 hypothetical protein [Curtobacterium sp. 20TX0008]
MGMKDRQSPAKKIVMAAATGAALGGGFAVGWRLLRGKAAGAGSRAQEQDATSAGGQPGHETQATSGGDQPGHETQATSGGGQLSHEIQATSGGGHAEPIEEPRWTDDIEVVGRFVLVVVFLFKTVQILCSAFAGWTWGDASAKQATAAAVALLAVQFSASALVIHRRWGWLLCDVASAGLAMASLFSLVPETGIGNSRSVLFAFLAIVPFVVVRCAEYFGATESVPVWDYYSTDWRRKQMRAEHARIAQLDADRKATWSRRRQAARRALAGLRDRLLGRLRRSGSRRL